MARGDGLPRRTRPHLGAGFFRDSSGRHANQRHAGAAGVRSRVAAASLPQHPPACDHRGPRRVAHGALGASAAAGPLFVDGSAGRRRAARGPDGDEILARPRRAALHPQQGGRRPVDRQQLRHGRCRILGPRARRRPGRFTHPPRGGGVRGGHPLRLGERRAWLHQRRPAGGPSHRNGPRAAGGS